MKIVLIHFLRSFSFYVSKLLLRGIETRFICWAIIFVYIFFVFNSFYHNIDVSGILHHFSVSIINISYVEKKNKIKTIILFSKINKIISFIRVTKIRNSNDLFTFAMVLWGCYLLAEQQTIALMMVIKTSFVTIITNLYIFVIILVLGTGALR